MTGTCHRFAAKENSSAVTHNTGKRGKKTQAIETSKNGGCASERGIGGSVEGGRGKEKTTTRKGRLY